MSEHRPGAWPAGINPTPLAAVADVPAPQTASVPEVSVPEVHLVVTVDLTGSYDTAVDVSRDFYEQVRRSSDCHTAIVHIGESAASQSLELGRAIAGAFFLSAKRIELHVPAGTRHAYLASEVRRHVGIFCADHQRVMTTLRNPG